MTNNDIGQVLVVDHTENNRLGSALKMLIERYLPRCEAHVHSNVRSAQTWLRNKKTPFIIIVDWPLPDHMGEALEEEANLTAQFIWSFEHGVKSERISLFVYAVPHAEEILPIMERNRPLGEVRDAPFKYFRMGREGALQDMMKEWIRAWGKLNLKASGP